MRLLLTVAARTVGKDRSLTVAARTVRLEPVLDGGLE